MLVFDVTYISLVFEILNVYIYYRHLSKKKFKLYLFYNDYKTSYTTYINHARWHRCLRSDGLRVGGNRSTRRKPTCLTWWPHDHLTCLRRVSNPGRSGERRVRYHCASQIACTLSTVTMPEWRNKWTFVSANKRYVQSYYLYLVRELIVVKIIQCWNWINKPQSISFAKI